MNTAAMFRNAIVTTANFSLPPGYNGHSTLEGLNTAWGTSFWSQYYYNWEDILPPRISPTFNTPVRRSTTGVFYERFTARLP